MNRQREIHNSGENNSERSFKPEIEQIQRELVKRNNLVNGMVYLEVTRGADTGRDFAFPKGVKPTLIMFTSVKDIINAPSAKTGIGVITVPDLRWARRDIKSVALLAQVAPRLSPTQMVSALRTSERQLVALAKALVSDARLVIMDEPSASMTDGEIDFLFKAIEELKAGGKSIIYITHRLDEVIEIAAEEALGAIGAASLSIERWMS